MKDKIKQILKKYFGYSDFKEGQESIIESILAGRDTIGIMPTGAGKSLCYQIPALLFPGITLVISPLISLMKDQVDSLDNLGISSTYINSSLSGTEIEDRIARAAAGEYRIIYIAPERLESGRFMQLLSGIDVSLLAVDEAHCVSQWGHDFRPSYRSVSRLVEQLLKRPVVAAFTATATEEVQKDILELLGLMEPDVYVTGFDRSNLYFCVVKGVNKNSFIESYINNHKGQSGIIYAATRKDVDRLYDILSQKGCSVGRYHAGLTDVDRSECQEAFLYDNIQIMIATNAFGMGIDKSNVRFVIHYSMPKNIEAYYQEAGRAGRDGVQAECILLFSASDVHIQRFLIEQTLLSPQRKDYEYKRLQEMIDYCHTTGCIRKYILEYFGEKDIRDNCGGCSNCDDSVELTDITLEAQKILSCVKRMGERFGAALASNVLKGSNTKKIRELGFDKLSTYGIMHGHSLQEITDLINLLIAEEYLESTGGQYPVVRLLKKAVPVLMGDEKVVKRVPKREVKDKGKADLGLFGVLKDLRKEISTELGVPPYVIFHDITLQEMCMRFPADKYSMLEINGVGENKFNKFGDRFLNVIAKYMEENGISSPALSPREKKPKSDKTATHIVSYGMFKQGKTLEEIAQERDLGQRTVEEHIIKCSVEGIEIEWDRLIPAEYEKPVLEAADKVGVLKLKPIKELLTEDISYFVIKAVLCKNGYN